MIKENIVEIKKRITSAALRVNRDPAEIKLLAVTKTHPVETIKTALESGVDFIGENRIQEAEDKLPKLENLYKEFHFIGHLQSNKIKKLMSLNPALIHSIDKLSTASKLNDYLELNDLCQDILIQINTSGEASKFGIEPEDAISFTKELSKLENLNVKGLMTIGMFTDDEQTIRACFRKLKDIFDQLKNEQIPEISMQYLSMGMTNDFEIAIEEGANIVRIGSAIFGNRNY
ncbi:MAG TPA: YggS family pyridoxal phosphate-dependent enzyme [Candidatus Cloacimonetes bacterium]|nr:YggS family pyridoxal phosphate-dependent enzyme [Candidatus Cloacimonadota bacterium]